MLPSDLDMCLPIANPLLLMSPDGDLSLLLSSHCHQLDLMLQHLISVHSGGHVIDQIN